MITVKEIANKTMNSEKKAMAKNDYFAFYVGRPISYVFTIPFLYSGLTPNIISLLSIIPLIIGFVIFCFSTMKSSLVIGWIMFFLWNILDGVDGNVARYKKQFSKIGSVYDAMSGYLAMVLTFFSMGISSAHFVGIVDRFVTVDKNIYIILGALSGIFVIFPRLIMHKAISTMMNTEYVKSIKNKNEFSVVKIIALNLGSVTGGAQVFMLISIMLNIMDLYTVGYIIFNLLIMIVSIYSILKNK